MPPTDGSDGGVPGPGQLPLEFGHVASHDEADFVVGDGNRLAYLHLTAFPDWPGPLTLLTGPASAGKSHLGRIWLARAAALTPSVADIAAFARDGERRPLLIEDVDRAGYDEQALFHLLNQSMRDRRPLLLTARAPVGNWPYATEDLRSRARLATLLCVAPPADAELAQMLIKLFGDRQVGVDPRLIGYVVPRMERSPAEAVALVELMDRLALSRGTAITRSVAAEALQRRRRAQGGLVLDENDDDMLEAGDE